MNAHIFPAVASLRQEKRQLEIRLRSQAKRVGESKTLKTFCWRGTHIFWNIPQQERKFTTFLVVPQGKPTMVLQHCDVLIFLMKPASILFASICTHSHVYLTTDSTMRFFPCIIYWCLFTDQIHNNKTTCNKTILF